MEFLRARLDEDISEEAPVKRRLFEDITELLSVEHWGSATAMREIREGLLQDLAMFYEGHPDHREEWRP